MIFFLLPSRDHCRFIIDQKWWCHWDANTRKTRHCGYVSQGSRLFALAIITYCAGLGFYFTKLAILLIALYKSSMPGTISSVDTGSFSRLSCECVIVSRMRTVSKNQIFNNEVKDLRYLQSIMQYINIDHNRTTASDITNVCRWYHIQVTVVHTSIMKCWTHTLIKCDTTLKYASCNLYM